MATTITSIVNQLKSAGFLEPGQIIYGWTDGLHPPYVSLSEYEAELTYDSGGPKIREGKFRVLVVGKSLDEAEEVAAQVDDFLNMSTTATPNTMRLLQDSYKVGQMDERLYQFGAELRYTLTESLK